MSTLQAYRVVDTDADDDSNACLVFAKDKQDALRLGATDLDVVAEYLHRVVVERAESADTWVNTDRNDGYVCSIDEACVAAGLKPDSWDYCCECGELTDNYIDFEACCKACLPGAGEQG